MLLFFSGVLYAQETKEQKPESKSSTLNFLEKDGTFFQKEYYDLPKIKDVEYQVLILKDMNTGMKMGCLRLIRNYIDDSYIGTLDTDELDACIQCLTKIQNEVITTVPSTYTEYIYKTRDGVELGTYRNPEEKDWTIFVQTRSYTNRSVTYPKVTDLPSIISNIQTAKQMITEKIK